MKALDAAETIVALRDAAALQARLQARPPPD